MDWLTRLKNLLDAAIVRGYPALCEPLARRFAIGAECRGINTAPPTRAPQMPQESSSSSDSSESSDDSSLSSQSSQSSDDSSLSSQSSQSSDESSLSSQSSQSSDESSLSSQSSQSSDESSLSSQSSASSDESSLSSQSSESSDLSSQSSASSESSLSSESSESCFSSGDSSSDYGQILRDEDELDGDWQPIDGQLAKALPGQKINLRLELPEGKSGTDFQWNLPGTVFKDFTGIKEKGELKPMLGDDLNRQEVSFYWAESGVRVVRVTYTEGGMDRKLTVTIDVAKPTATLSAELASDSSQIGPRPDVNAIDNLFIERITFKGFVNIPGDFGETENTNWSFVQLATLNCSRRIEPSADQATDAQDGGTYFDGGNYPYAGNSFQIGMNGETYDDPGVPLVTSYPLDPSYGRYTADLTFIMYIMFTPPGYASRQVPLLKLPWSWSDAVDFYGNGITGHWERAPEQRNPAVQIEAVSEDHVHPLWQDSSDNHKDLVPLN